VDTGPGRLPIPAPLVVPGPMFTAQARRSWAAVLDFSQAKATDRHTPQSHVCDLPAPLPQAQQNFGLGE
jgi:hypothetical protein